MEFCSYSLHKFCSYYAILNIDVNNEELGQIFYCEQDNQISDDKNKATIVIALATSAAVILIVIIIILILVITCCWRRYKLQSMHVAIQLARCLFYLFSKYCALDLTPKALNYRVLSVPRNTEQYGLGEKIKLPHSQSPVRNKG